MKRILSALRAALKAATSSLTTVWSFCKDTGKWVGTAVASMGGGGGAPEVGGHDLTMAAENDNKADQIIRESKALLDSVEVPKAFGGDGYDRIQRICRDTAAGGIGDPWDLVKCSILQAEWIEQLTPEMHFIVGNSPRQAVVDHMKGKQGLKGVIRYDRESIKDWKRSNEMEQARALEIGEPVLEQEDAPGLRLVS